MSREEQLGYFQHTVILNREESRRPTVWEGKSSKKVIFQNDQLIDVGRGAPRCGGSMDQLTIKIPKQNVAVYKNWQMKGLRGRWFSELIGWRYNQFCWYFRPSFVNYCHFPLLSGLIPAPPPLRVNKYGIPYMYTVCNCGERAWGSGPQTDKHLTQSPYTGQFFDDASCIAFYESYLSTCGSIWLCAEHSLIR